MGGKEEAAIGKRLVWSWRTTASRWQLSSPAQFSNKPQGHYFKWIHNRVRREKMLFFFLFFYGKNHNFSLDFRMDIFTVSPGDLKVKWKSISDGLSAWYKHVGIKCIETTYGRPIWHKQAGLRNIHPCHDWFVSSMCEWSWKLELKSDLR